MHPEGLQIVNKRDTKKNLMQILSVPLEEKVKELLMVFGPCKTSYILREAFNLTYNEIARLLGTSINYASACVSYFRRSRSQFDVEYYLFITQAPSFEVFREACGGDAYSVGCQMLEAEAFMYDVARNVLPVAVFWDVILNARVHHRVIFPDVYTYIVAISNGNPRRFLRAVKRGERWYTGAGIAVYAFLMLDESYYERGYGNMRLTMKIRNTVKELTGIDPLVPPWTRLTALLSHKILELITAKAEEIRKAEEELYHGLSRKFTL